MLERVGVLRDACEALGRDANDTVSRSAAREAAHKLSGSLGIFGLSRGTELAAAMEEVLKGADLLTPQRVLLLAEQTRELDAAIRAKPAS